MIDYPQPGVNLQTLNHSLPIISNVKIMLPDKYVLDFDKVQSLEDVIEILKDLSLVWHPAPDNIMHLVKKYEK